MAYILEDMSSNSQEIPSSSLVLEARAHTKWSPRAHNGGLKTSNCIYAMLSLRNSYVDYYCSNDLRIVWIIVNVNRGR